MPAVARGARRVRGGVGAAVVDEDDLERPVRRERSLDFARERLHVVDFVADRDDDGELHARSIAQVTCEARARAQLRCMLARRPSRRTIITTRTTRTGMSQRRVARRGARTDRRFHARGIRRRHPRAVARADGRRRSHADRCGSAWHSPGQRRASRRVPPIRVAPSDISGCECSQRSSTAARCCSSSRGSRSKPCNVF